MRHLVLNVALRLRLLLFVLAGLGLIVSSASLCAGAEPSSPSAEEKSASTKPPVKYRSRMEFAKAINLVKKGMTEKEVRRLLGPPDDIRNEQDPVRLRLDAEEIWCYGTSGHLTTATLGEVCFDRDSRVLWFSGRGTPKVDDLPDESELRPLLNILNQVQPCDAGCNFNPRPLIQAVNALLPLGKKKALAVVEEFLRIVPSLDSQCMTDRKKTSSDIDMLYQNTPNQESQDAMSFVLDTLFEKPRERMSISNEFAVVGDIPFSLFNPESFGSFLQSLPLDDIEFFREHRSLRKKPLIPVDNPFLVIDEYVTSGHKEKSLQELLNNQALLLLDTVYQTKPIDFNGLIPSGGYIDDAATGKAVRKAKSKLRGAIRWDDKTCQYTFVDGTTLPPMKPYLRRAWRPKSSNPNVYYELSFQRTDPIHVSIVFLKRQLKKGSHSVEARVYAPRFKDQTIVELTPGSSSVSPWHSSTSNTSSNDGYTTTWTSIRLKEGTEICIDFTVDGKTQTSPVLKP